MNFFDKIKKKINDKKFKKYHKEKRNKIFLKPETTTYKTKRKKKFSRFKVDIGFKDLSLKDYYEKFNNKQNTNYSYYFFVGFTLIILSIYSFFFSDYFNIKNIPISIEQEDKFTNIDIAYKSVDNFRFNSIFFISKMEIEKKIKDYQNNIKSVKIKRLFPNTLRIDLESYPGVFNTNIEGINYIVLRNGTLVPSALDKKLINIDLYYKDLSSKSVLDYKKILKDKYVSLIKYLEKVILENIGNIKIKTIRYFVLEREAHIILDNDIILIFSLDDDPKIQLENLLLFYINNNNQFKIKDENTNKFYKPIYLDLRIANKIIYCSSKNSFLCKKNLKRIYDFVEVKTIIKNGKTIKKVVEEKKKRFPKIKLQD